MQNYIIGLVLLLMVTGCQPAPSQNQTNNGAAREASQKFFAQGLLLLQQKDVKGAVTSLEASIKADPSDPNPYLLLGQILIKAEQYDQAVEFLDQTAKNFRDNGTVFYMLSIANKMDNKIAPAVLSARRSYEIFNAAGDAANAKNSAILLEELIHSAQQQENKNVVPQNTPNKTEEIFKKQ